MSDIRTHYRICPFCEQNCGVVVQTDHTARKILSVRGDKEDPFSRGYICPKAYAMKELHDDPDVLKQPMIRRNGQFEPVSWTEALDYTAARLNAIKEKYGANSIALFFGNPIAHVPGPLFYLPALLGAIGTNQIYSAASVDHNPQLLTMLAMYGSCGSFPVPDIDRIEYFVLIGTNPMISNGSCMTAPGVPRRLEAIQARGGKIVCIDPRRSETAQMADWYLPIKPEGDAWLMLALVHTLFDENLADCDGMEIRLKGLDALRRVVADYPPESVEARTGLAAADIRKLAREFAASRAACMHGRVGTTLQSFGSLTNWLMQCFNILTGNLDRVGGLMFPGGVFGPVALGEGYHDGVVPFGRWRSRVSGAPELAAQIPMAVFVEEIETPGDGQMKALITCSGNPSLSCQNDGGKMDRALGKLDFMMSFDIYINETTRHADVILPAPDLMSHSDYPFYYVPMMVRDFIKYAPRAFDPLPGEMVETDVFCELAARLRNTTPEACEIEAVRMMYDRLKMEDTPGLRNLSFEQVLQQLGDEPGADRMFDLLLRSGPYGDHFGARPEGLTIEKLARDHPHGVEFGAMKPGRIHDKIFWPDKKIDMAPEMIVTDMARLRAEALDGADVLRLVGRRHMRSNNSWMHNLNVLVKGPERCTLLIHPEDAERRGIADGSEVEVASKSGTLCVKAELTDEIRPGVVSLPHGWGHHQPDTKTQISAKRPGVNANFLAETARIDGPSFNAAFNGVRVTVRAVAVAAE